MDFDFIFTFIDQRCLYCIFSFKYFWSLTRPWHSLLHKNETGTVQNNHLSAKFVFFTDGQRKCDHKRP